MADQILPDGRMVKTIEITIPRPPPLPPVRINKQLLLDTGGITMIPLANVAPFFGIVALGPMHGTNFGTTFDLIGATMTIEVTDHQGLKPETRTCSSIRVHFREPFATIAGVQIDGLLGMDQFDNLHADPAKSLTGETIRVVKRE
jgi:hypothetical protein